MLAHTGRKSGLPRVLAAYRALHPRWWGKFKHVLEETLGTPVTDAGAPLPMVELRLD